MAPPSNTTLWRMKVESIANAIERAPPKEREGHITIPLAANFNEVLEAVREAHPEYAPALPKRVGHEPPLSRLGRAAITYLDLRAFCDQVMNALHHIEQDEAE